MTSREIVDALMARRRELGLNQTQAAIACGMSQSVTWRMENRECDPKLSTVVALAEGFGMEVTVGMRRSSPFENEWVDLDTPIGMSGEIVR